MQSMRSELVQGLNVFMDEQRKVGPANVTVVQFDNTVETVIDGVDVSDVPPFSDEHFQPRGMTALLDGIGSIVSKIESRLPLGKLGREVAPIIVILTDGQENASQSFSRKDIFDLIKAKKELGWRFTFMGANQDAVAVGESYGVDRGSCATYDAAPEKQRAVWKASAGKGARERLTGRPSSFTPMELDSFSPM